MGLLLPVIPGEDPGSNRNIFIGSRIPRRFALQNKAAGVRDITIFISNLFELY